MSRRVGLIVALLILALLPRRTTAELRDFTTRYYTVHTDLDESLAGELGRRLDAMYDQYAQRLAVFKSPVELPRLDVSLFRYQKDYMAFTHWRLRNTGGVFVAGQNRLAAYLEGQGRDQLRRTLQHEAFHQFAYNAISRDFPVWLNEGLAQFFEEGLWNGSGFLLGEVPPRRVLQLQADLKYDRLLDFSRLLPMTNEQWARRLSANRDDGAAQYNQSWAMVHFLVMAHNSRGEFIYRARLLDMLRFLHDGKSGDEAFEQAFGTNIRGFQDRFMEYARALGPTSEATLIEDQAVLADLLIDLDRRGKRFEDVESFRRFAIQGRYRLHYYRGNLEWDTDSNVNRYFCDLNGRPFSDQELFFSVHGGSPLPDLICHCGGELELRTRFYDTEREVDHELAIQPMAMSASISN